MNRRDCIKNSIIAAGAAVAPFSLAPAGKSYLGITVDTVYKREWLANLMTWTRTMPDGSKRVVSRLVEPGSMDNAHVRKLILDDVEWKLFA